MPAFFIVGSARSGTTLLRVMLNAHSEIAVPPESRFITELYDGDEVEADAWLERLAAHQRFQAWNLPIEEVRARLDGRAARVPYPRAVDAAFSAFAAHRGKSKCGDKTPRYIEDIPLLARLFPEARFVHMVRDGRDVAMSYADVPFGPKTVARVARLWSERVARGMEAGSAIPDRYWEISYEDFVAHPEAKMKSVCGFIGIEFEDDMLDYAHRARSEVLPRAARYNPRVMSNDIIARRSWRRDMPAFQVEVFESIAGDMLEHLGYERRFPRPRARAHVAATAGRLGLPLGRLKREPTPTRRSTDS
jgi:Sulfotransferase family